MKDKTETYIGFAIKKRAVIFGVDAIVKQLQRANNKICLILLTKTLSDNSVKQIFNAVNRECRENGSCAEVVPKSVFRASDIPTAFVNEYDILVQRNCKAIAICDKELANAILKNLK